MYEQAGNKEIISSADVDGGALRAINTPLVDFQWFFSLNYCCPLITKIKAFQRFFIKFRVLLFPKAETLDKRVLTGLWKIKM